MIRCWMLHPASAQLLVSGKMEVLSVDHHLQVSWLKWKNLETIVCTSGLCSCCSMALCDFILGGYGHQWAYMKPRGFFSQPGNEYNNLCAAFSIAQVEIEKVEMVAESMLSGYQQMT